MLVGYILEAVNLFILSLVVLFFFSSRRRHTRFSRDWSSDVCSSDLQTLGATAWQTFRRVIFPPILPALLSGFVLSLARGLGEFGAVIFIAGNMPYETEVISLLIMIRLAEYDYASAAALASVMLAAAFALLISISLLQGYLNRHSRKS